MECWKKRGRKTNSKDRCFGKCSQCLCVLILQIARFLREQKRTFIVFENKKPLAFLHWLFVAYVDDFVYTASCWETCKARCFSSSSYDWNLSSQIVFLAMRRVSFFLRTFLRAVKTSSSRRRWGLPGCRVGFDLSLFLRGHLRVGSVGVWEFICDIAFRAMLVASSKNNQKNMFGTDI